MLTGLLLSSMIAPLEAAITSQVLCQKARSCRLTLMASLPHAPFPYHGRVGDSSQPFFDKTDPTTGQPLHTVSEGVYYPEDPHYLDNRVLIHLPPSFKPKKPFEILVFFHGHNTELHRTLVEEMALLKQVNASGRNVVVVAPQLALDATDSSPGKLYRREGFTHLLEDVANVLKLRVGKRFASRFAKAPVILTAFSGGYRAMAFTLDRGFANEHALHGRLKGVILLDGLYGEADKFQNWLQNPRRRGFFINLHTPSSRPLSLMLEQDWQQKNQPWFNVLDDKIKKGQIYSLPVATPHLAIPLAGPPPWPLATFLKKIS